MKKKAFTGDNLVPGVLSSREPRDRGRPPHRGTSRYFTAGLVYVKSLFYPNGALNVSNKKENSFK